MRSPLLCPGCAPVGAKSTDASTIDPSRQTLKDFFVPRPLESLLFGRPGVVLAQEGGSSTDGLFLGEDFFPWMVLAIGAAMVVGNLLALLRPPEDRPEGPPPVTRAVVMVVIGLVGAIWGLASLLS